MERRTDTSEATTKSIGTGRYLINCALNSTSNLLSILPEYLRLRFMLSSVLLFNLFILVLQVANFVFL